MREAGRERRKGSDSLVLLLEVMDRGRVNEVRADRGGERLVGWRCDGGAILLGQTSANHDDEMWMYGISAVERSGQSGGRGGKE